MSEFSIPIRVYIEDTDAGGIVFYANYLKYMERARTELLRQLGYAKAAMVEDQALLVVASANIVYKSPAYLDEQLLAVAVVRKIARTYVIFDQQVRRGEQPLCTAEIKVACVNASTMRPQPLPEVMVADIRAQQAISHDAAPSS